MGTIVSFNVVYLCFVFFLLLFHNILLMLFHCMSLSSVDFDISVKGVI